MPLQLQLTLQRLDSYDEIKDLSEIQQKQLEIELKAYFGKKTSLKAAFKGECIADFWQVVDKEHPEVVLYDFWQMNADSGGVFYAGTTKETGVEMIQGSFDIQAGFLEDKNAKLLVEALANAERTKAIKSDYLLNDQEEVEDFKSSEFMPKDVKEWVKFLKNQKPSESFIRKYHPNFNKKCWDLVSASAKLSEEFLVEFSKKVNWTSISQHQKLSEQIIENQKDKVNWISICLYQELSENFIRKHQDVVNWDYLCGKQKLSENFIREFKDKVAWHAISWGQSLSVDFILEFQEKLSWDSMMMYQQFSEDFLRKFTKKFDWNTWHYLCKTQNISIAFIQEFADKIVWGGLSMNHHLTDEHLRTFKEKIEWNILVNFGRSLTEELIKEFEDYISASIETKKYTWKNILENKKKFVLSEDFRNEIKKKIDE